MGDARSLGICSAIDLGDAVAAEPDVEDPVLGRRADGDVLAGEGDGELEVAIGAILGRPFGRQRRQPFLRVRPTKSSSREVGRYSGSGRVTGPQDRKGERRLIR